MEYSFTELLWLFLIYSTLGWIFEAVVGTIKNKRFTNRGFSTGPFCIIYGFSAVTMQVTLADLTDNPIFLFLGCGIQATAIEWFAGKILERLNRHKWWDYSNKRWNFDGYICLEYTLLWAILGTLTVRYGNTFFLFLYKLIPEPVPAVITWVLAAYVCLDSAVSLAAVFHLRRTGKGKREHSGTISSKLYRAARTVIGYVERRMAKAYPVIEEKSEEILKEGKFAEGCGFYKLYKDREKPDRHIFLIGTLLGGAYEYACSVFTEIVFGQVFWDYSGIPFNLGGRINLLYCFFWGIAAVVWIKLLYPRFSGWIERIPKIAGYIATWILVVFMAADIIVSAAALIRYDQRAGGYAAKSGWEQIIDENFDDDKIKQIYPNAKQR